MGREGERVGREEQDGTRQGRAGLKCGGKPRLSALLARLRPLCADNESGRMGPCFLCIGTRVLLQAPHPFRDNVGDTK